MGKPDDLKGQAIVGLRHPRIGPAAERSAAQGAARPRRQGDRRAGPTRRHPLHRRAAQDPQRQDHAAPAARHRRRRREHRRHDDARRPQRAGAAAPVRGAESCRGGISRGSCQEGRSKTGAALPREVSARFDSRDQSQSDRIKALEFLAGLGAPLEALMSGKVCTLPSTSRVNCPERMTDVATRT